MYKLTKAILDAQTNNGEDGQELVEGALMAIRDYVINLGEEADLVRLANYLKSGQLLSYEPRPT